MTILEIDNFVIKEGKTKEFQDWIKKNEKAFAALLKKSGMKYRGTYYYAMGTGAQMNAMACFMTEFSNYGDIDASLKLFKDPEDERISRESMKFLASTPTSSLLLRPIGQGKFYRFT